MVSLLKTFGKGILYVLGFPFFLIALVLFGVIGLFAFIFQLIRSIIYFFTGQKFFPELPEDKELRLLKEGPEEKQNALSNEQAPLPEPEPKKEEPIIYPYVQEPEPEPIPEENIARKDNHIEAACVNNPPEEEVQLVQDEVEAVEDLSALLDDEKEEEETLEDSSIEESLPEEELDKGPLDDEVEATLLETSSSEEVEEEEEEELEQYIPRSSNYSNNVDEDDDTDDDGGVDIKYDV